MKILKKYFQNQKSLQKLDIKHVPQAPNKIFKKTQNFEFKKKGPQRTKILRYVAGNDLS